MVEAMTALVLIEPPADRILSLEELAQPARHGRVFVTETDQFNGDLQVGIRIACQIDNSGRALAKRTDDLVFADFL